MNRRIVLLRGINLGPRRRVPMAELRELLSGAGFEAVRTYVASGNVVLDSDAEEAELVDTCARLIAERFGFDVPVVTRTRDELAAVVVANPLGDIVTDPRRYQVTFMSAALPEDRVQALAAVAVGEERLVADGRELYAWHPHGVARSKLWSALAGAGLGVIATARNWTTVTALLALADAT